MTPNSHYAKLRRLWKEDRSQNTQLPSGFVRFTEESPQNLSETYKFGRHNKLLESVNNSDFTQFYNKIVLLHEHKRHTARHVASAHSAALCPNGYVGATPIQSWGSTPILSQGGVSFSHNWIGVPPSGRMGVPLLGRMRVLPSGSHWVLPVSRWGYPHKDWMGYPCIRTWWGYSPSYMGGWGYPTLECELTHKLKILPSPILRIQAVIIYVLFNQNKIYAWFLFLN